MLAGGNVASTHYARAKYKLPEAVGTVFTYFYAKSVIVLPSDFYERQNAGFRILNTDNYTTTLNGVSVGAANANELRVSVYLNSDHKIRILVDHELGTKLTLYTASAILPTGEHTFELAGDVANVVPWYFKIDGVVVASGTQRLSPDDTLANERVLTRIVTGIDGAADQDSNSVKLTVKSLDIANYDISGAVPTSVPPTNTPISVVVSPSPTATLPAATVTQIPPTVVQPIVTNTMVSQPTNTPVPPLGKNSVDVRIKSGINDVEESGSGGINVSNSDLELVYDNSSQAVGLRFPGIQIPKNAIITNAYIQFKVDETSSGTVSLTINCEASVNASEFTKNSRNVSNRPRTTNKITWSPPSWTKVGEQGGSQRTPNLNSIIQEIVNQSGWASGNSLVMIITGSNGKRVAEAYEDDAAGAPLLHVEYSIPAQAAALQALPVDALTASSVIMPTTTIPTTIASQSTQATQPFTPTTLANEVIVPTNTPVPIVEVVVLTETSVPVVP